MQDFDYTREFKLKHDELPATINADTGEVKVLKKKKNNIPENKSLFMEKSVFKKYFPNSWAFLRKYLTHTELNVAYILADKAKMFTNSLAPLSDTTTIPELMETLELSKNIITPILKKLHGLGVYGKFDIANTDYPYYNFWIVNPFLVFSGKMVYKDMENIFSGTHVAKAHIDKTYVLSEKYLISLKISDRAPANKKIPKSIIVKDKKLTKKDKETILNDID